MPVIKPNKKKTPVWTVIIFVFGLIDLALLIRRLLHGHNVALFNPKGQIAHEQHSLMIFTLSVLFAIAIPTLSLLYFFAWRYRESNTKVNHNPQPHHSKILAPGIWMIPTTVMLILVSVMAPATHKLVPQKVIAADAQSLTIEVISLRWKWLFIYPDQGIASLNFVQLPVDTPVTFEMTADETPMSSFWIPNLGGQLYTMTSHVNRLNLMAVTAGDYPGSSAEINGAGFAGMKFTARAGSMDSFVNWEQTVKQSPNNLDIVTYKKLLVPSEYNRAVFYSSFDPNLYASVIGKYEGPGGHTH
ncbi:MAG TPA: COX aromatic rich motif-containing protein [Patescibacteria group bacterium]|nr:COX aromatic rich motif-containing protein [Patescibacteria group bacterium]